MTITHGGNIFEAARSLACDWRELADFSASINPLGPSPALEPAIRAALDRIAHYPEREHAQLRNALAQLWRLAPENLLLGNGATELLHFFARTQRHEAVTIVTPAFSEFHRAYPHAHLLPYSTPNHWPTAGLLILTQPDNPNGRTHTLEPYLRATVNPVLIDESFLEFTGLPSAAALLHQRPNLYVLRSLTKFYALPGLRLGALIAHPDVIAQLRRQREPWQVNVLAEAAALAAIADRDHAARALRFIPAEREWMRTQLARLPGVHPHPSCANYLFITLDYSAAALAGHLLRRRILIREIDSQSVRIAIRTREENLRLLAAWKEFPCAS